jgi:hypothetical protein
MAIDMYTMVSIMNTKACRVMIRMWNSAQGKASGNCQTEQGDQDEHHFAGIHVAKETQASEIGRAMSSTTRKRKLTGASLMPNGTAEHFVHEAADALHLETHKQIMMQNTVIDMAKVRLGSVVGTP